MAETIAFLTARGVPVMAHVGLTPQAITLAENAYNDRGVVCKVCDNSGTFYVGHGEDAEKMACPCGGKGNVGQLDNFRLTLLADALEESGCDNSGVVAHLRSTAKHYRGCHVLDAILGLS